MGFGHVLTTEDLFVATGIGEGDEDNFSAGGLRVQGEGFDVELETVGLSVSHLVKEGLAGEQEVLADGGVDAEVGDAVFREAPFRLQEVGPGVEMGAKAKFSPPFEGNDLADAGESGAVAVLWGFHKQPRGEGGGLLAVPGVEDHSIAVQEFDSKDGGVIVHKFANAPGEWRCTGSGWISSARQLLCPFSQYPFKAMLYVSLQSGD